MVTRLLEIQNPFVREKGTLIMRMMMSKLKFKYSLKPAWIEKLKRIFKKGNAPNLSSSLKRHLETESAPMAMRTNPNNLKLNVQTLDEYIVEDVTNEHDLDSHVSLLSSDGFLKLSDCSEANSVQDSEKFVLFLGNNEIEIKKRENLDKKLFRQRLRIEFSSKSIISIYSFLNIKRKSSC